MYEDQKVFIILVLKFSHGNYCLVKKRICLQRRRINGSEKNGEYFFKAILCSSENLYSFKKGMNLLSVHEI